MIADLKPYPAMKNSGVPWLGEVPKHWEVRRLKRVARPESGGSYGIEPEQGELVLPVATTAQIDRDGVFSVVRMPRRGFSQSEVDRYGCCVGDVLVVKSSGSAANVISGKAGIVRKEDPLFVFSNFLLRLRARRNCTDPEYLFQLVTMNLTRERVKMMVSATTYPNLKIDEYLSAALPLPPLAEQSAIVRFLNHADRHVRRYIRAKLKLVKLLEEQKQAIIHRAVTCGLDPNVRLKPSGVEWLGQVPKHWELRRLKTLVRVIEQGVSPQAENRLADDGSWGVLKAGCANRGIFRETEHKRLPTDFRFDRNLGVETGDVLVSRASGSPHLVGSTARVQSLAYRLILSDKTFRPVFNTTADSDFMVLAMNSRYYRQQVEQAISGAEGLANNLPLSSLRSFVFAVPPMLEQRAIVEHIRGLTNQLIEAIDRSQREISLLHEYRTRLIADVVTGKLDVRKAAANLPDESDEPEVPDDTDALAEGDEPADGDLDAAPEEAEA